MRHYEEILQKNKRKKLEQTVGVGHFQTDLILNQFSVNEQNSFTEN